MGLGWNSMGAAPHLAWGGHEAGETAAVAAGWSWGVWGGDETGQTPEERDLWLSGEERQEFQLVQPPYW